MSDKVKCKLFVGPPGCGKSYIAEMFRKDGWKIFSSDYYRFLVSGDENNQACTQEAFTRLYKDMRESLINGENCILDATNINIKDRARVFNQLQGIPNLEMEAYIIIHPFQFVLSVIILGIGLLVLMLL